MKILKNLVLISVLLSPLNLYAGLGGLSLENDASGHSITGYYDLRERKSYFQITNTSSQTISIHIQIFQNDKECNELNFNDELTANDTVIYDMENITRNDGSEVPVTLDDDSNGYVVISYDEGNNSYDRTNPAPLIGNFRIVDNAGYEYRTNMNLVSGAAQNRFAFANFNTVDNASHSDIILYVVSRRALGGNTFSSTVFNRFEGVNFNIFVFDMNEEPLSCDNRNFACGNEMNYGVNEDYPNSRSGPLLCPGGGLADPLGGFITFENLLFPLPENVPSTDALIVVGYVGLNNNNGTGSLDAIFNLVRQTPI